MDEVDRVFRHLIEVLADEHPERLHKPLQASEIYQTIIPYRRYRSALRFDSNQDYEMALLRLLSGERDYVSVEPPQAQDELRAEAEGVNPNPGTIREYAGVKVFLNSNLVRELLNERDAFAPPEDEPYEEPISVVEDAPIESFPVSAFAFDETAGDDGAWDEDGRRAPATESTDQPAGKDAANSTAGPTVSRGEYMDDVTPDPAADRPGDSTCRHCGESLPPSRTVIFCPYCGNNQSVRECTICGTELEADWVFCVICGNQSDGG